MTFPPEPAEGSAAFRAAFVDTLSAALGKKWSVLDQEPQQTITKPVVLMQRTKVDRVPRAANSQTTSTYTVILISNQTVAETKETYLDGLFDQLSDALEDMGAIWATAERAVWNGTNPAYNFTLTASTHRLGGTE